MALPYRALRRQARAVDPQSLFLDPDAGYTETLPLEWLRGTMRSGKQVFPIIDMKTLPRVALSSSRPIGRQRARYTLTPAERTGLMQFDAQAIEWAGT